MSGEVYSVKDRGLERVHAKAPEPKHHDKEFFFKSAKKKAPLKRAKLYELRKGHRKV